MAVDRGRTDPALRLAAVSAAACCVSPPASPGPPPGGSRVTNSGRSTYSLTVWISYCPAPMVTVGTPCLTSQLASRPPLENRVVGFRPIDSAARLACSHRRRVLRQLERRVRRLALELHLRGRPVGVLHLRLAFGEGASVRRRRSPRRTSRPRLRASPLMWT